MTRGDGIAREGDTGGDVTSPHGLPPVGAATTADNYPGAGAPAPGAFWWTREEDEILAPYTTRAFRAEDIRRIAEQLGRTPQAVKRHVSYMRERLRAGLPLHGGKGRVPSLSADEYRTIADMRARGATLSTIANRLRRSVNTIQQAAQRVADDQSLAAAPVMVTRRCIGNRATPEGYDRRCMAEFSYDRTTSQPLFLCEFCRSRSVAPLACADGGNTGRQAPRLRA